MNGAADVLAFLLAMVGLAVAVFVAGAGLIYAGNWLFDAWTWLLHDQLALPRPAAMALGVMGTAAVFAAGWTRLVDGPRRRA